VCVAAGATPRAFAQQAPDAAPTDPAGPEPTATPEGTAATPSPPASGSGLSAGGWRIPPILTFGSVAYDLRLGRGPGSARSTDHLVTTTYGATTYLYQPWFAIVSGSLGLTMSRSRLDTGDEGPFAEQGSSDRFTTGNLRVDVFPRSRFPFEVHYDVSDSRIDSGQPSTFDYRSRTFGMSQKYRPADGRFNLSGSAERRVFDNAGSQDTLDALVADFNTRWKANELSVGGSQSSGQRGATDESTLFRSIVGRHHYSPGADFSLDNTVNWTQTRDQQLQFESDVGLLQMTSVGVWHPEKAPWTLSGSARALLLDDEISGFNTWSYGISLGASYEVSQNLRLNANGSVNGIDSDGETSLSRIMSLGATYQGDTIELRGFRYDWFGAGSVSLSEASDAQRERSVTGQLGHTLSRTWITGEQSALAFNLGQSINATKTEQFPPLEIPGFPSSTRMLVHNAALSWNTGGADRNGYARVSYSDSAELGGAHARFQMFNFQLSGTLQFDRNQSLSGDLTVQWSKQRTGDTFDFAQGGIVSSLPTASTSRGGELSYRHNRLFDVPRLRFSSRLRITEDVQDQPGVLVLIPDRETRLWENRLDWNIGRLESQLVLRISWVEGQRRDVLMWRVQRTFGN